MANSNAKKDTEDQLKQVEYLMTCVRACLKSGGVGNRMQAARCMNDAATILIRQSKIVSNMTPPRRGAAAR